MDKSKSKDEKSHILQHQKELKERIQSYRAMQMDLLEKMRKDREEEESQEIKVPSMETHTDGNKGKCPMEHLLEVTISQHLKALMHTSKQSRQKLEMMTSVMDTQAVVATASKVVVDIQVTAAITQTNGGQQMAE